MRPARAVPELCVQAHSVRAEEAGGQGHGLPLQGSVPRWEGLGWELSVWGTSEGRCGPTAMNAEQRGAGWRRQQVRGAGHRGPGPAECGHWELLLRAGRCRAR